MADVVPFRGIRYQHSADLAAVTSPPYDVISPEERDTLERGSPYNVVRLDLGRDEPGDDETENKYTRAAQWLDSWLAEGILRRDGEPSVYLYEQRFTLGGATRSQRGVIAAAELSDEILPHERTMAPVVEDRLRFLRATGANVSPVLCLYWTSDHAARAVIADPGVPPYAEFSSPDGVAHRAWRLPDPAAAEAIARSLAGATVMIADGHHRYATAMAYRDERRRARGSGPWDLAMLYLVDAERDGPALLPIHRLVSRLSPRDAVERLGGVFEVAAAGTREPGALEARLAEARARGRAFGILGPDDAWVATVITPDPEAAAMPKGRSQAWMDLDVAVLHTLVFDRLWQGPEVTYVHSAQEAAQAVGRGHASFAVLLAPTPLDAVRAVAEAREAMPPKSTYFVPKPRTGMAIRRLEP